MLSGLNLMEIIIRILVLLLSLSVRELAYGLVAYKLGDSTARTDGWLSLNPIRHIDPIGLFCMLFFRFGWAKPVMVDLRSFKDQKQDMALTAFEGPLSNFILAFVALLICVPVSRGMRYGVFANMIQMFLVECFYFNISLGVFTKILNPLLSGAYSGMIFLVNKKYFFL